MKIKLHNYSSYFMVCYLHHFRTSLRQAAQIVTSSSPFTESKQDDVKKLIEALCGHRTLSTLKHLTKCSVTISGRKLALKLVHVWCATRATYFSTSMVMSHPFVLSVPNIQCPRNTVEFSCNFTEGCDKMKFFFMQKLFLNVTLPLHNKKDNFVTKTTILT